MFHRKSLLKVAADPNLNVGESLNKPRYLGAILIEALLSVSLYIANLHQ